MSIKPEELTIKSAEEWAEIFLREAQGFNIRCNVRYSSCTERAQFWWYGVQSVAWCAWCLDHILEYGRVNLAIKQEGPKTKICYICGGCFSRVWSIPFTELQGFDRGFCYPCFNKALNSPLMIAHSKLTI